MAVWLKFERAGCKQGRRNDRSVARKLCAASGNAYIFGANLMTYGAR